ncbi:hypothetical protein AL036_01115 [Salipiger aestuarii]|uniref:Uncharacterized protein DUF2383 n=1 Tax=Salipiger aestuarii TaxID=568098 RepID=A0A327YSH1_9RHOB|nr:DUF2383 domain-containing protein [Salipiger aestuarii]EIE49504.1 hypothetical protein C357_18437 [Citreicella sp. 357]KAA8610102.1 hypothetical protein AL036_01115 [Salipiger aestuarii]KAA8616091.1 hypothetical protein AL037_02395 [Salipiger aestuarii]KAB2543301.1 hypothetical protein AL035_02225 [Salipiger aestuarii]RAK24038.1 uncharacterized protein DUF2383 [Salipiger aestuarii]
MNDVTPITATKDQLSVLQHLLSRSADCRAWFAEMADKAEPDFRFVALKFRGLHVEQSQRIAAIITALGGDPDGSEGFRAAISRTTVSLRSLFGDVDGDMMAAVEDAEAQVLGDFDAALSCLPPSPYRDELAQMKRELIALLADEPIN